MRRLVCLVLLVGASLALAGCGGGTPEPLALKERVLQASETSALHLRPLPPRVVTPAQIAGGAAFPGGDQFLNDQRAALKRLKLAQAGIVAAVGELLAGRRRQGHGASDTVQFGSPDEAKAFLDKLFAESFAPCPTQCSVVKEEFDVSGIKDAKGAALSLTTGPAAQRFRAYRVEFADGVFVYGVAVYGSTSLSQDQVVATARSLYERVKHRPPPAA